MIGRGEESGGREKRDMKGRTPLSTPSTSLCFGKPSTSLSTEETRERALRSSLVNI